MAAVRACQVADIAQGEVKAIDLDGTMVAVVHTVDGEFHAVNDTCSHGDISLAEGFVEGCALECIGHGSKFDLVTGQPENLPAYEPIAVYATKVKDGAVFVDTAHVTNTIVNKEA